MGSVGGHQLLPRPLRLPLLGAVLLRRRLRRAAAAAAGAAACSARCTYPALPPAAAAAWAHARRAIEQIRRDVPWAKITAMYVDLASQDSIRTFVAEFLAMGHPLHLLVRHRPRLAARPGMALARLGLAWLGIAAMPIR
jgi:hypothetical protein